jgi:hypothetical protein
VVEQRQARVEVAMARTFEDLLFIQKKRGYKNNWAQHVWMARGRKELKFV